MYPVELLETHQVLASLRPPEPPVKEDTVRDSETAMEGESVGGVIKTAIGMMIVPWFLHGIFFNGGDDQDGWPDYVIGTGLAVVGTTASLYTMTDIGFWSSFGLGCTAGFLALIAIIFLHLTTHTCYSIYLYNRIFRRGWMERTRQIDQKRFEANQNAYPIRMDGYHREHKLAMERATVALEAYNESNPEAQYILTDRGFEKKPAEGISPEELLSRGFQFGKDLVVKFRASQ